MTMLKSAATLAVLLLGLAACDSGHNSDDESEVQAFDALVYEVLDEDADAYAVDLNDRKLTVLSDEDEEVFSALF